jgi:hypothetical protein
MPQQYTHLLPKEIEIWERFLARYGRQFVSFDYDVHLGPGAPIPADTPEWMVRQIEAVSRDRVDVVAHTASDIVIIEIKPRGGKGAVGQLLQYERLYIQETQPTRPVRKALVCERLAPGVEDTCRELGITIYIV